ncbi:MAG TPA: type II toxin-antitoxin system RelE/ParE family toxin [Thermoanaerobaculia bacterium]
MAYRPLYLPGAEKDIRALPSRVAERVRNAVGRLAENPRLGKRLGGELVPFWSYLVGDYRLIYEIRDDELIVLVVMLGYRRAIYERARRKRP